MQFIVPKLLGIVPTLFVKEIQKTSVIVNDVVFRKNYKYLFYFDHLSSLKSSLHRFCEKMELNELVRPFARLCSLHVHTHNNVIGIHGIYLLNSKYFKHFIYQN